MDTRMKDFTAALRRCTNASLWFCSSENMTDMTNLTRKEGEEWTNDHQVGVVLVSRASWQVFLHSFNVQFRVHHSCGAHAVFVARGVF